MEMEKKGESERETYTENCVELGICKKNLYAYNAGISIVFLKKADSETKHFNLLNIIFHDRCNWKCVIFAFLKIQIHVLCKILKR